MPANVGISYPSLDEPPPVYSTTNTVSGGEGVGQLIDLGFDLPTTASTTVPNDDITLQLAALGMCVHRNQVWLCLLRSLCRHIQPTCSTTECGRIR